MLKEGQILENNDILISLVYMGEKWDKNDIVIPNDL